MLHAMLLWNFSIWIMVYHTHTNDLLNALLEYIKFYLYIHIVFLLTYLSCFIHQTYSQLFINCMFFLQKLDLKEYT